MCRRVECSSCGKPTFAGCGAHVEEVLREVPREQRCKCRDADSPQTSGERSAWSRLFGTRD